MSELIVVYGMKPLWGMPSPSPFCSKLETWLKMAGIPYEARAIGGPPRSQSGKVPYIVRPDGSFLSDSSLIIETLSRERGVDLDAHLSPGERAVAHMLKRTIEEHLYWTSVWRRWVDDAGFALIPDSYFADLPPVIRGLAASFIRRKVIGNAYGQGISRHSRERITALALQDIDAASQILGEAEWFFGGAPSTLDAIAFAFFGGALSFPLEEPVKAHLRQTQNLVAHVERVRARWWPELRV